MENQENAVDTSEDYQQTILSNTSDILDVLKKIQEQTKKEDSTPMVENPSEVSDTQVLVEQVQYMNVRLDNLTSIGIVLIVGVGILVGALATKSFFEYLWG